MNYIWESAAILFTGFCLIRIAGKKTVAQMSGLEVITILTIASTTGHAISEQGLLKTILALCALVVLLMIIQFLAIKFKLVKKIFIGEATPIIQDGKIMNNNLKKLRISIDQLEARLRENGISSISDVKTASFEVTGEFGYMLKNDAKPVTIGDLDKKIEQLKSDILHQIKTIDQKASNDAVLDNHKTSK